MNLGQLITYLEEQEQNKLCKFGFHHPHSYRGYYEQLAFEPTENITIGAMLGFAKEALNKTYNGYKGGEYTMNEYTEVWISNYGEASDEKLGYYLLSLICGNLITLDR